ncbi:DNA mismatch repair protein MutT [Rhizobium rhizosphaerae]|uniref:DNA mismatch repair protein MutT n=1 Tax=Xaviernesmea rhizosphaerae TaxID=1672749 RepID=A0A1Q9AP69_9HYPH|nr:NUDIX domain-containing protein [Xaviernesmea rhizosphaerae]OLP57216.1 DNA mismatch repair protein MutT [Xaviernesmea rhizosphaerae]
MSATSGHAAPRTWRRWRRKLLLRAVHAVFFLTRGMTLGVRAACFDAEGRIFLVRHGYVPGWHLPGGGVERGETAAQALAKELREEGNLVLGDAPRLLQVYFNRAASRRDHVLLYVCRNVTQTAPRKPDAEIREADFFALDALPPETTGSTRRRLAEIAGTLSPDDVW